MDMSPKTYLMALCTPFRTVAMWLTVMVILLISHSNVYGFHRGYGFDKSVEVRAAALHERTLQTTKNLENHNFFGDLFRSIQGLFSSTKEAEFVSSSSEALTTGTTPCQCAIRWEEGGHWELDSLGNPTGMIIEKGSIPDPQGIVRCGSAADTESGLTPCIDPGNNTDRPKCKEECEYDPAMFNIDVSMIDCFDPNNLGGPPVDPGVPAMGCPITWLQFDVRHLAGTWQFQIVTGSVKIGWALYATTAPTNDGTGGDCSSLELQECGIEFSNTWSTITTPEFETETNYYLAFWGRGLDSCNYVSLNFKARNGCGDAGCFISGRDTVITCLPNGDYIVRGEFNATSGDYYVVDHTGLGYNLVEEPPGLIFGAPGDTGYVELTYPYGSNYNFSILSDGDTCLMNFQGSDPGCHKCVLTVGCPASPGPFACIDDVPLPDTNLVQRIDSCFDLVITTYDDTTGLGCGTDTMFITRRYIIVDDDGDPATQDSTDTCVQVFKVIDTIPPTIICPSDTIIDCSASTSPTNTGEATATDNCGTPAITYTDVRTGACPVILTRTWIATDGCGSTSSCVQVITLQDTTAPTIFLPGDLTIDCMASTDPVNTGEALATDDCSGLALIYSDTITGSCPEILTRTWTATDDCGNVASGNQIITIEDNTAPTVDAPLDITLDCPASTDTSVTGVILVSDNCSGYTISYSDIRSGACPELISRTWIATDDCGNATIHTQYITVQDITPPLLTCPVHVTIDCADSTDPSNTGEATATDNCSGTTITYSDVQSGSCPTVISRTWSAEDSCGNITPCVQFITVDDNIAPVIICLGDVTIDCNVSTDPSNTGYAFALDNCGGISLTYTDTIVGLCPKVLSRTWSAVDTCLNSASCVQLITIADLTPPTITCPGDVTIDCNDSTDPANTGEATATDDCSGASVTTYTDVRSGSCPEILTRTWSVEDSCGNAATCVQVITIQDNTPPILICPGDVTIDCSASTDPANTGEATATDDCSGFTITYVDARAGACPEVLTRTWTAEDDCGNVSTCVQVITIDDTTPPTITCPGDVTIDCNASTDPANTGEATATDDCMGVTVTYVDTRAGACPEVLTRVWSAEDGCGNVTSCTQVITIDDTTPPVITCPGDVTIDCNASIDPANTGEATATDDCSGFTITFNDTRAGACPEVLTRVWTAEDDCGNVTSCTQLITIDDTTPPVITCPGDVTIDCNASTDPANTGEATATDDCGSATVTYVDTRAGACPEVLTRVWTAEDDCGNVTSCTQLITIHDTTPPTLTCPGDVTIDCSDSSDPANTGEATATDDCGGATVTYVDTRTGACPEVLTRTWRAEDDCGNVSTCVQVITIEDTTPPTISCPGDVTIDCSDSTDPANTGEATATDDCMGLTVTFSDTRVGTCTEILTRVWTAEDGCGNVASCTQIITIIDNTPPTVICPNDVTIDCAESTDPGNTGELIATDDCGGVTVSYSDSRGGACPELLIRVWRAEDDCGNVASCIQEITIEDNTPPTLICPSDVTIECTESTDPSNTGELIATDDCGSATVTYVDTRAGSCPEVLTRTWSAEYVCTSDHNR
jgi:hypothetical protein